MRTSIRPDDIIALGPLTEEVYVTDLGVGRLLRRGDLPIRLELPDHRRHVADHRPVASHWVEKLERYFAGEPVKFELDVDAHADFHCCTAFELDVYRSLAQVPYGEVVSYRDLAIAAGHANAYRAVGSVMARNALPILLPCHRVIKNDGRLGWYGSDPAWKERLLTLEGVRVREGRVE